ncbi:uncharacterized protein FFB20_08739 [Fusarium fujikuroi]|nr:uncharacterized protein FFE2_00363 [Fusarium fujikuroi]SCN69191.1 uncharacterized protein FFC1_00358 [Fusarium fujikuroi]SCN90543.1 uncharacterized protein FFB20_08739 [Fusarium fujikuroi]
MPQTDMYSSLLNTGSPVVVVLHLIPPQLRVLAFLLPLRLFRPILKLTASPPSFNRRPSGPFLDGLAVELKEQIIRLVDPIGLISLRQTNLHFRSIIEPQRQQSIERLLALECLPRYGGSLLPFTKCPGKALWSDPDLLATQTRSRWACTGCKRLLPYYHFQYKFLAEVIWRKPPPGSPATKIITSWEPGLGRIARVVTPLTPLPADGGRSIQDRYNLIVGDILAISPNELFNQIRNHNLNHFEGMHYGDFLGRITYNPNNIRELLLWNLISMQNSEFGSSRHHRKCNACQFKNHVFNNATIASHNGMFGTQRFPIISIENHMITSPLDRYFPGELRAFRFDAGAGPGFQAWEPDMGRLTWDGVILTQEIFDKACCNACFMEQNGQSALAEYLCRWFVFLVKQQPEDVQSELLSEASRFMTNYGAIIHPTAFQDWNQTCLEIDSSRSQGESPWHLSPRSQLLFKHWFRIFGLAADAFPDDPRGQFHKQRV